MERREFIKKGSLFAFAVSTFGFTILRNKGTLEGDCATTDDILGPYYRHGARFRDNFRLENEQGELLTINGKVFDTDCITPVRNVFIDLWHADTRGNYDNTSNDYNYRGKLRTDEEGNYQLETIVPGRYLNGQLYRPSHIHIRVKERGYQELISQIYFKDDPYLEKDPWASQPKAINRILEFKEEEGLKTVNFDIYLAKK